MCESVFAVRRYKIILHSLMRSNSVIRRFSQFQQKSLLST